MEPRYKGRGQQSQECTKWGQDDRSGAKKTGEGQRRQERGQEDRRGAKKTGEGPRRQERGQEERIGAKKIGDGPRIRTKMSAMGQDFGGKCQKWGQDDKSGDEI